MKRRLLLSSLLLGISVALAAQPLDVQRIRTYDGSFNNLDHPQWGAAGTNLLRLSSVAYADGISEPAGPDRPNPRRISNTLFAQDNLINDPLHLSDFCWVWGQFLDHDFGLTPDGAEPANIKVPTGDPQFDPLGQGQSVIPMRRNLFDPATGTGVDNPRQHPNIITAYIDGSGVYGSDETRANWLRSFSGGKLKVSAGNMPPFNTTTGEFDAPIDPNAPHMDNPVGLTAKLYVCGDSRANENPLLLSFHTLFVREHNRLCDKLARQHPDWTDEQLFQHARRMVGGLIQSVVYDEWLPTVGVHLPEYTGYKPDVNAQLFNEFTAAAFRLGHTLLNSTLRRLDNNGEILPQGHLALRDAFFNIFAIMETGGIDPFFKGMATQVQQEFDPRVIDDVRNFLFGPPGAGGLDLASININRGRERGLPDLNTIRASLGLPRYQFFQEISPNAGVFATLLMLYGNINAIDPWVGMLSEKRMPGALFGETLMAIMVKQFTALRDGDRFFYLNDPELTQVEKDWIRKFSMRDIIMYNTGISLMQDNVFEAMPHSEICDHMTGNLSGRIFTENGTAVPGVHLAVEVGGNLLESNSSQEGGYAFEHLAGCEVEGLTLFKDDPASKGVTTLDLIVVQKHVLGVDLLDSPYKMIAADVDNNHTISTLDLIRIRKVVLGVDLTFANNNTWRFIPAEYEFINSLDPFAETFPEALNFNGAMAGNIEKDFIAVKVGDVNLSAVVNLGDPEAGVEERTLPATLALALPDQLLKAGETYTIDVAVAESAQAIGFQFTLAFDPEILDLQQVTPAALPGMTDGNFGLFHSLGRISTSWNGETPLQTGDRLFSITFRTLQEGAVHQAFHLTDAPTPAAAYDGKLQVMNVAMQYAALPAPAFALFQNYPNPFAEATSIPFELPHAGTVQLRIFDGAGRTLLSRRGDFAEGRHEWIIRRDELPAPGVLYYQLESESHVATRRMVLTE